MELMLKVIFDELAEWWAREQGDEGTFEEAIEEYGRRLVQKFLDVGLVRLPDDDDEDEIEGAVV